MDKVYSICACFGTFAVGDEPRRYFRLIFPEIRGSAKYSFKLIGKSETPQKFSNEWN